MHHCAVGGGGRGDGHAAAGIVVDGRDCDHVDDVGDVAGRGRDRGGGTRELPRLTRIELVVLIGVAGIEQAAEHGRDGRALVVADRRDDHRVEAGDRRRVRSGRAGDCVGVDDRVTDSGTDGVGGTFTHHGGGTDEARGLLHDGDQRIDGEHLGDRGDGHVRGGTKRVGDVGDGEDVERVDGERGDRARVDPRLTHFEHSVVVAWCVSTTHEWGALVVCRREGGDVGTTGVLHSEGEGDCPTNRDVVGAGLLGEQQPGSEHGHGCRVGTALHDAEERIDRAGCGGVGGGCRKGTTGTREQPDFADPHDRVGKGVAAEVDGGRAGVIADRDVDRRGITGVGHRVEVGDVVGDANRDGVARPRVARARVARGLHDRQRRVDHVDRDLNGVGGDRREERPKRLTVGGHVLRGLVGVDCRGGAREVPRLGGLHQAVVVGVTRVVERGRAVRRCHPDAAERDVTRVGDRVVVGDRVTCVDRRQRRARSHREDGRDHVDERARRVGRHRQRAGIGAGERDDVGGVGSECLHCGVDPGLIGVEEAEVGCVARDEGGRERRSGTPVVAEGDRRDGSVTGVGDCVGVGDRSAAHHGACRGDLGDVEPWVDQRVRDRIARRGGLLHAGDRGRVGDRCDRCGRVGANLHLIGDRHAGADRQVVGVAGDRRCTGEVGRVTACDRGERGSGGADRDVVDGELLAAVADCRKTNHDRATDEGREADGFGVGGVAVDRARDDAAGVGTDEGSVDGHEALVGGIVVVEVAGVAGEAQGCGRLAREVDGTERLGAHGCVFGGDLKLVAGDDCATE